MIKSEHLNSSSSRYMLTGIPYTAPVNANSFLAPITCAYTVHGQRTIQIQPKLEITILIMNIWDLNSTCYQ